VTTLDTGTPDLVARVEGRLGRLTLSRPAALNALTWPMLHGMHRVLRAWRRDPAVETVLLEGTGPRAFCAGGDITVVHASARSGGRTARSLWRHEYALDLRIARYPKPVVSVLHGLVLGGGVGISSHRPYRVVTGTTEWGMPEVGLGLSPDVGGLLLLSRFPGELGTHLALTGQRIGAVDCLAYGVADAFVPVERLPELASRLARQDAGTAVHGVAATPSPPTAVPPWMARCYAGDDAGTIVAALRAEPAADANRAADRIEAACPTAVAVTLAAIRRAASMSDLAECLHQDYRLSTRFLGRPDLAEGIRAAVIDKDRRPRWSPPTLADVDPPAVQAFFAD
jgi:enoyl-CoA hydratase